LLNAFGVGGKVTVDPQGDALVVTTRSLDKLVGATGDPLWHAALSPVHLIEAFRTDRRGDVIVETVIVASFPQEGLAETVLKFDGRDGTELWRQARAQRVLDVGARGNVIVGRVSSGRVAPARRSRLRASVASLDPTTGEPLRVWRLGYVDEPLVGGQAVGSGQDVLVSVVTGAPYGRPAFGRLLRLRGTGRRVAWTHSLGRVPDTGAVPHPVVAVGSGGDVVAAWVRYRPATSYDLHVITLSGATGRARRD
jgi:hypothetical protein